MKSLNNLTKTSIRSFIKENLVPTHIPLSTYRLQLHKGFSLKKALAILPYLKKLGIDTLYTSPIFQARSGSAHGYDMTDPAHLNPELGSEQTFSTFFSQVKKEGFALLVDWVPNHMGIGKENPYWIDVLESGPRSRYADFFDIHWHPEKEELRGKILLPILGDHYGRELEKGHIRLVFRQGSFGLHYYDRRLPICPVVLPDIFRAKPGALKKLVASTPALQKRLDDASSQLTTLPSSFDPTSPESIAWSEKKIRSKQTLHRLYVKFQPFRDFINDTLKHINGAPGRPRSFDTLDNILSKQVYRLASWRVASEEINYRRFFDINDLASVCMENDHVFAQCHQRLASLVAQGQIQGLRLDHPDGLYDPVGYFRKLQGEILFHRFLGQNKLAATGDNAHLRQLFFPVWDEASFVQERPCYIVAEKILATHESLPNDWNVHGTVGYDFLADLDALFVQAKNDVATEALYAKYTERNSDLVSMAYEKKKFFALVHMPSEIRRLAYQLDSISESNRNYRDFTLNNFTVAIREIIANFPVYRTYIRPTDTSVDSHNRRYIKQAVALAKKKTPALPDDLYDFIEQVLLLKSPSYSSLHERSMYQKFVSRFQQLSAPIMAKGVEDTVFYCYNRLISLNEVGQEPSRFGISSSEFHHKNEERLNHWPLAMTNTSTHDTKRSEDVRMRIHALSEIPSIWEQNIIHWNKLNLFAKAKIDGRPEPEKNTEYLIYQTLLGAWPQSSKKLSVREMSVFLERISGSTLKAVRESKERTNWINPNHRYEDAVRIFLKRILTDPRNAEFLRSFRPFAQMISRAGMLNSLSALSLKTASPGMPDFYQGNELWDYSLVDPDNRRPVDFHKRETLLMKIQTQSLESNPSNFIKEMLDHPEDGRIKLFLTSKGLHLRKQHPDLFISGNYQPLSVVGPAKDHVIAFLREVNGTFLLAASARFFLTLDPDSFAKMGIASERWQDTRILLPSKAFSRHSFKNLYTRETVPLNKNSQECSISAQNLFKILPTALVTSSVK